MAETTPGQALMNREYDRVRRGLAKMRPEIAEFARRDIRLFVLRFLADEIERLPRDAELEPHAVMEAFLARCAYARDNRWSDSATRRPEPSVVEILREMQ